MDDWFNSAARFGPAGGISSPAREHDGGGVPDEDFLFHLSRGGEFLVHNRVVEAKQELERALAFRPQDSKSQDLLAGVYFRLGVYPRAIEMWSNLVRQHPSDVTLRVNLGLALLKTGQPEEALEHLMRGLAIEPDHARAWGYVGLVLWRQGRLEDAREAFLRGGQASMARRMEELSPSSAGVVAAAVVAEDLPAERDRAAVRSHADGALDRLSDPTLEPALVVEHTRPARERSPSGQWRVVEAGVDVLPAHSLPASPIAADAPMSLSALLDWWAPHIPDEQPLVVAPSGVLMMSTRSVVHGRGAGLRALRGEARTSGVARRTRRGDGETMGDEEPMLRWEGAMVALVAPKQGESFQAIRLDDDALYAAERFVQAFDDRVTFESGRLPMHAGALRLVQFRGRGTVVLRVPRPPTALPVRSGQDARVAPGSLLGWTGRLFPVEEATHAGDAATLSLRGEGTLLLV